jgi:hypothetical protein
VSDLKNWLTTVLVKYRNALVAQLDDEELERQLVPELRIFFPKCFIQSPENRHQAIE